MSVVFIDTDTDPDPDADGPLSIIRNALELLALNVTGHPLAHLACYEP
jgi:hypothetical protein